MVLHKGCKRSMAGDFLWGLFRSSARLSSHARRSFCKYDKPYGVILQGRIVSKSNNAELLQISIADLCCQQMGISKYSNEE